MQRHNKNAGVFLCADHVPHGFSLPSMESNWVSDRLEQYG